MSDFDNWFDDSFSEGARTDDIDWSSLSNSGADLASMYTPYSGSDSLFDTGSSLYDFASSYLPESDYDFGSSYSTPAPQQDLVGGNWGAYGYAAPGTNNSYEDTGPGFMETLNKYGTMLQSPGGQLLAGLGGAAVSALSAMQQNKLQKEAYKRQQKLAAERKAEAMRYNEPLRLSMNRETPNPTPVRGESVFFTNNKLPSYYAEGGSASSGQPSVLGFIKYMMAGKKLPYEVRDAEEAKQRRLMATDEPSAEAGLVKLKNRKRMIDEATNYCGGGSAKGALGYVKGGSPGQADKINAMVSDGEYVMDADVVSALGDGNNEAGAAQLDQMREKIRQHKRSAPKSKIPPKAKSPLEYMKKGAK